MKPFDLQSIIKDIKDGLEIKDSPTFSFLEEYNGDTLIYSDKGRLHTILRNLITNAVKYRKKETIGALVKLVFTRTGNRFAITVSDNGQGIASKSMEKVFDMFYRATSAAPGTGLGFIYLQGNAGKWFGLSSNWIPLRDRAPALPSRLNRHQVLN